MCIKIIDEPLKKEALWYSVTAFSLAHLSQFRNGDASKSNLEAVGRRVAGGLGYAALGIASIVEMVVRVALGLILLIPCIGISFCGRELEKLYTVPLMLGFAGLAGPDTTIRCVSAFVQNFYREKIRFEELPPLGTCL